MSDKMTRAAIVEARVLDSWRDYQEALRLAIEPLTNEQISLRPVLGQRSAGEVAEHIVYGRALWLSHVLGEGAPEAAELKPFLLWDDPDDPPRTAAEVLLGLDLTWRVITATLTRWSANDDLPPEEVEHLQIIWGLVDHDLPHAGELSLLLGVQGLPGVEI